MKFHTCVMMTSKIQVYSKLLGTVILFSDFKALPTGVVRPDLNLNFDTRLKTIISYSIPEKIFMKKIILDKKQQMTINMHIPKYATSLSNAFGQSAPHEYLILLSENHAYCLSTSVIC